MLDKGSIYYVVTLRKHRDGKIYRRVLFIEKEDAIEFVRRWSKSLAYYVAKIECLEV